jgi:hypothetical protein
LGGFAERLTFNLVQFQPGPSNKESRALQPMHALPEFPTMQAGALLFPTDYNFTDLMLASTKFAETLIEITC